MQLHGLQTFNTQTGEIQLFYLNVKLTHMCSAEDPPYVSNMYKSFKISAATRVGKQTVTRWFELQFMWKWVKESWGSSASSTKEFGIYSAESHGFCNVDTHYMWCSCPDQDLVRCCHPGVRMQSVPCSYTHWRRGTQWWDQKEKSKGNQKELQGLGMTG